MYILHIVLGGVCASWAFAAEVPSELIQFYGDWKSDAYKIYLKYSLDDKISVATKMTSHILNSLNF